MNLNETFYIALALEIWGSNFDYIKNKLVSKFYDKEQSNDVIS